MQVEISHREWVFKFCFLLIITSVIKGVHRASLSNVVVMHNSNSNDVNIGKQPTVQANSKLYMHVSLSQL